MPVTDQSIYRRKSGDPAPEGMVLTPGGYRHPSLVHHLPKGHKVRRRKKELQIVHRRTQRIVARYSVVPGAVPDPIIPGLGSGWATSVSWLNPTGTPISQFTTTWTVPPDPAAGDTGQVVYLFNGLQNPAGTNLLQPVLQWGTTSLGGGPYWTISNWYIDDLGVAVHSHFLRVPSGEVLTGVIARGPDSGGLCSYSIGFQEYPYLSVPAAGVDPSPLAVEVLESYRIGDCSEYPAAFSTLASSIFIAADGTAPAIVWTPKKSASGCKEQTSVLSSANPGGEVEVVYAS